MRARSFFYVCAGLLFVECVLIPEASGQTTPSEIAGAAGSVIVTRTGDVVVGSPHPAPTCCQEPLSTWCIAGNLFASAGQGVGRVVGVNQHLEVLSSAGDEYQITSSSCSNVSAYRAYNVWEYTGVSPMPSEEFVAYGAGDASYSFAVTSMGRVFRRLLRGCDPYCIWVYAGTLYAPTSLQRESVGSVKVRYR